MDIIVDEESNAYLPITKLEELYQENKELRAQLVEHEKNAEIVRCAKLIYDNSTGGQWGHYHNAMKAMHIAAHNRFREDK